MNSKIYLSLAGIIAAGMITTSCSKKLGALSPEYFNATPSPLEAIAGQVPVTINGIFPEKYMKKKAVVTVTPVLRYAGGEATGEAVTFQGEKVQGNDQTIAYKVGGNYTTQATFNYVPAMAKSELYLTFDAKVGNKVVEVPAVKIADGVVATSALKSGTVKASTAARFGSVIASIKPKAVNAAIRRTSTNVTLKTVSSKP